MTIEATFDPKNDPRDVPVQVDRSVLWFGECLILALLLANPAATRAQLQRYTGFSKATVQHSLRNLKYRGLAFPAEKGSSRRRVANVQWI